LQQSKSELVFWEKSVKIPENAQISLKFNQSTEQTNRRRAEKSADFRYRPPIAN